MKRISLILSLCVTACTTAFGQIDTTAINRPINLLNSANQDIENGDYEEAVQKLIVSIRLNPQIRDAYLSLNTACSYTDQISILKSYLLKAKEIFREDDEICYYLGNIFQKENNFTKAIQAYTEAIKYAKQNGEDYELVYAYYQNRGACYLKTNQFAKAIPPATVPRHSKTGAKRQTSAYPQRLPTSKDTDAKNPNPPPPLI